MNDTLGFLVRHGPAVLFAAVFIEQIGVPIPAAPLLLATGALVVAGKMSWVTALSAAVVGSLVADSIWFYIGRRSGKRVLRLLCRISLEPDSCVNRTQDVFTRYGMPGVIVAKFLFGVSTLVPALAGGSGVRAPRFFFFDGIASALYGGSLLLGGVLFSNQLEQLLAVLSSLGSGALALVASLVALFIGYKYFQRQRLLRELRMARITVDELHRKQEAGENPFILDLRASSELDQDPSIICGALHMSINEVEDRQQEIPRDREIVLYGSSPNDAGAAHIARLLHRRGFARVRPLLGGFDAWRERNYPTELRTVVEISQSIERNLPAGVAAGAEGQTDP